jgi:hypothetical protein
MKITKTRLFNSWLNEAHAAKQLKVVQLEYDLGEVES